MIKELNDEMHQFLDDIKDNIKDPQTLSYLITRTEKLFDVVLKEVENITDYKSEELNKLKEQQKEQNERIQEMENRLKEIYRDIYDEDGDGDFEIICPYCSYEFSADVSEAEKEIPCPECGNTIELDWSGDPDKTEHDCNGDCSGCNGCEED